MTTPAGQPALTLPEIVAAVPALLARGYEGVRNGRVRDLPDIRTIRWYQSLGILDRPTEFRGRAALYRRRHILQIATIKKLQASGLSLDKIQGSLAGRTDAEFARALGMRLDEVDGVIAAAIAARDAAGTADIAAAMKPSRRSTPFWKSRPVDVSSLVAESVPLATTVPSPVIQSKNIGGGVVVLWNGRPLTPSEQVTLKDLSSPLVAFLSSVSTPPAERGESSASSRPRTAKTNKELRQ